MDTFTFPSHCCITCHIIVSVHDINFVFDFNFDLFFKYFFYQNFESVVFCYPGMGKQIFVDAQTTITNFLT
jgi:hypothetical protein